MSGDTLIRWGSRMVSAAYATTGISCFVMLAHSRAYAPAFAVGGLCAALSCVAAAITRWPFREE